MNEAVKAAGRWRRRSITNLTILMSTARILFTLTLAAAACAQGRQTSPQHELLAQQAGVWDAAIEYVDMETGKTVRAKGTSVRRQPLGSFWLIDNFQASVMGAPLRVMRTTGYDPTQRRLVGTWIDSMTPSLSVLEGSWDRDKKVMTLSGGGRDQQGRTVDIRLVTSILSENKHVFEKFTRTASDKEAKTMTVTFTRRARQMDRVRE